MSHLSLAHIDDDKCSGGLFLTESNCGLLRNESLSVVASRSHEGNGVESANELLEGDANTIGPREAGVAGDGGV